MTALGLVGRASGVAAALGVGALISLATSAPGVAAPQDSPARPDNGKTVSKTKSKPRPALRVSGAAPRPATTRPSRPATRAVRPAADVAEPFVSPTGPAPARAAAPDRVPSQSRARTGPPIPTPKASLCDPRGRRLTILKGTHLAIPSRWSLWLTRTSGDATFVPDSAYDLKDEDQYDWNKLAGITFTPWRPERNAAMVVWRYNLSTKEYEVGPFFDNDFAYVFPSDAEVISVPVDQTFRWSVDYTGITVSYGDTTVFKPYPPGLTPRLWTSAKVTGWFGGSEAAPRTLSYFVHMR